MHYIGIGQMSKFSKINSWDEFSPLKTILLGSVFAPEFFTDIKNKKIEYALKKVFDETTEDLDNFKTTMESNGIKVHQSTPNELGYESSISDYISEDGKIGYYTPGDGDELHNAYDVTRTNLIPAPPLQVRDETIIMGNEVFVTENAFTVYMMREKYVEWFGEENCNFGVLDGKIKCRRTDNSITSLLKRQRAGDQFLNIKEATSLTSEERDLISSEHPVEGFCAPNITRIGKKCLVDIWQTPDIKQVLEEHYPQFDYHEIDLFGHDDSVFSVLKPGLVIAAEWVRKYNIQKVFPNWEIIYFNDPNWLQVNGWKRLKGLNKGTFWVPGEEENDAFTKFVGKWLDNWTGEVEETIFDVNCLVIDDRYVVVNSDSPDLTDVLHKHNMEPIFCPLRHRFFFDGGWHCLTLDIERDGNQIDYGL